MGSRRCEEASGRRADWPLRETLAVRPRLVLRVRESRQARLPSLTGRRRRQRRPRPERLRGQHRPSTQQAPEFTHPSLGPLSHEADGRAGRTRAGRGRRRGSLRLESGEVVVLRLPSETLALLRLHVDSEGVRLGHACETERDEGAGFVSMPVLHLSRGKYKGSKTHLAC